MDLKNKTVKKALRTALSVGLALLLLLSTLLLSGCGGSSSAKAPEADVGSCGTGVEYEFNGTLSRLTIKGSGDMTDYTSPDQVPWAEYASSIEKVVISESITSIGDYAFYYCTALEKVTMEAKALASIGSYAFWMNRSLVEIEIPATVTEIGANAFAYCTSLTTVSTENLATIGAGAFMGCTALEVASLDGTLTSIPEKTFMNCTALKTVAYSETVTETAIDEKAFVNANADVKKTVIKLLATLTIEYVDADGNALAEKHVETLDKGAEYSVTTPTVEGYTIPAGKETLSGTMPGADVTLKVVYTKAAVDTEPAGEETDAPTGESDAAGSGTEEESKKGTQIIFLVLLVVIVIAIVVGAVLLMRSGKNITKDSQTVRKNDPKKNSKGKKK